ncbi:1-aminocyclopropane-1-carboxylate deaminase/D-cysteine desulfhydrase [Marinobacterium rhizophilum]|uniref:Pyridoxal-phosphate dependent enzyme n=1 Tax=Marinobacterium rhizophilum TaxID=420402 RepID=A0ABY5HN92_9GAMM|nr:pyridoxal-phosphate dependent enzyme [Marinobacterium rhizophilum]UTW13780.1 pyridoxal-phosphate dependent enzyme [Marinobacterium rhizophilum]
MKPCSFNPFESAPQVPLQPLELDLYSRAGVDVWLLRLDLAHSRISGNKWYKLKYTLQDLVERGERRVLTFGGAYSNHVHALAFAGQAMGIETIGVIRGEPAYASNPTLSDASAWGMQLEFVDRVTYRNKQDGAFRRQLRRRFGRFGLIAEGGFGALGLAGCREILAGLQGVPAFDLVCAAVGTGGTLAGLIASCPQNTRVLGFSALKGGAFLQADIAGLLQQAGVMDSGSWKLQLDAHCGGYGRISPLLAAFMPAFTHKTGVVLDPVYTGKMLLRFNQLVADGEVRAGSRVLLIHTGGLQGLRGMEKTLYDQGHAYRGGLPL